MTDHGNIPYGVDETAARLATYRHVLRELTHLSAGRLAPEPRFEVKALLGDHLHDDARAVAALDARLAELGRDAGAPNAELRELLDRAAAYEELKPSLIAALREHLARLDPLLDEPGLRLLTALVHQQERHLAELPPAAPRVTELGGTGPGEPREPRVTPAPERPARDGFVTVVEEVALDDEKAFFHALLNAELHAAERAARQLHESPGFEHHVDLARQVWDGVRHAQAVDRLLSGTYGCHWGELPVSFADLDLRSRRPPALAPEAARVLEWVRAAR